VPEDVNESNIYLEKLKTPERRDKHWSTVTKMASKARNENFKRS
jgi:hypothetical protein